MSIEGDFQVCMNEVYTSTILFYGNKEVFLGVSVIISALLWNTCHKKQVNVDSEKAGDSFKIMSLT